MFKMNGKKGLAPVVATLLIILLTVVSVTILAAFLVPFVKDNLSQSTSCLDYRDYFKFQEKIDFAGKSYKYNCNQEEYYGISVKASASDEDVSAKINGFEVVFYNDAGSKKVDFISESNNGEVWVLGNSLNPSPLKIPVSGEIITYVYASSEDYERMEIYPLLKTGSACELTDSINILPCENNVILG